MTRHDGTLPSDIDRRLRRLALAAFGSLAAEPAYVLIDTAIVGRELGTAQLGGLAVAATVLSFVAAASNFLTYGTTERVARLVGSGRTSAGSDVGVHAIGLSLIVGTCALVGLLAGAPLITSLLGADGDVGTYAVVYLRISACGIPFVILTLAAQGIQRGYADFRTPLVILLLSNLLNVVLEILFVVVWHHGMAGSAWSTVIAQGLSAVAFAAAIRRPLAAAGIRRPSRAGMRPLITAGGHLLLRVGSMLVVLSGATAVAARVDDPTLAAHQVAVSLLAFIALSLDAFAVPAQTMVAEALGRADDRAAAGPERWTEARLVSRRAVCLSVAVGAGIAVIIAVAAWWLPALFTRDHLVEVRARAGLWWLAGLLVPASIAYALDGVLIGTADYRFLGRAALGYLLAVAPVGIAVIFLPRLGIGGIWSGLALWMVLRASVNSWRAGRILGRGNGRAP